MDEKTIIGILNKWNLWNDKIDVGIKRKKYVEKIFPYLERKEIIVLKGIRRCGKSTIAKQLIAELISNGVDKKQILYVNLEDYGFADNLNILLFDEILAAYKKYTKNKKRIYFFIDEIQKINGWEKWIRTKYDLNENIKFIITGSSASLLSKELSTLLTGRNISFRILPLSFGEFLQFRKKGDLNEYLKFGGFPEVVLEKDEEKKAAILHQYLEDILHKDIIARYNVRNSKQLIDIARYLLGASGSKISTNKLSKIFGISKDSVSEYINYMADAYLLHKVNYFSYSAKVRHDVTKLQKIYATDCGFVNIVSLKFSENTGQLHETAVLIKLLEESDEICYFAENNSEVDFIIDEKAINVTATDKIPEREEKGLEEFLKKHKKFAALLVTKSTTKDNLISIQNFLNPE